MREPAGNRWLYSALLHGHPNSFLYLSQVTHVAAEAVRHSDHETIVLHDWCRVLMNEEHQAPSRRNLAFLD